MLEQKKSLQFNESDLLHLLCVYQTMMEKVPDGMWKKELQEVYNYWNRIWWELDTDENYYLFSEPF